MTNFHLKHWCKQGFIGIGIMYASISKAFAYGVGYLPFNSTMDTIKDAISGPFLLAAAIIMIVVTCLMLAFGEWGDGFKKMINIVLWLSIAFAASGFVTSLFGSGAGF